VHRISERSQNLRVLISEKPPSITRDTGHILRARLATKTRARSFAPRELQSFHPRLRTFDISISRANESLVRVIFRITRKDALAELRGSPASGASALVRLRPLSRSIIESIGARESREIRNAARRGAAVGDQPLTLPTC
jgi:hypothetical protein